MMATGIGNWMPKNIKINVHRGMQRNGSKFLGIKN
jgi:hypothetical protein